MSKNETSNRNSLIIKIALFLNYLDRDNHPRLVKDLQSLQASNKQADVFKVMLANKYVNQQDMTALKKICIGFAQAQEDSRLGSLCVNFGFITQSNLDLALEEQQKLVAAGNSIMLGDLLVDAGMISERQRNLLLQKQKFQGLIQKSAPTEIETKPVAAQPESPNPEEEEPLFDKTNMREIREPEVVFLISNDGLQAFITKTNLFDSSILLSDLKFLLEKNGIIYGLADDDSLETFIKDPKYHTSFFELAKGLEPIDGTDAQIIFMFERDYLKPGELAEDGSIDFKERGEIPFVAQGDVLAEKIPPKEGRDGVNIFGDVIPKKEARDLCFNLGKGVRGSTDGLKVISTTEGNPKFKTSGEISVNDAYFIEGDVDYTTGHIKFNKNVYITGSIKNGFRVEAIDVVANTIDGGFVKADGDVFIQNGVTDSTIEAKGSIKVGFMHRSKASCLGDMNVVKEIVDSQILLEGTFEMTKGRVFSSSVCAKGGAKIYTIGSERTGPSSITVGTSNYLETELHNIDQAIERRQNILESKTLEKNKADTLLAVIMDKLKNFDQSKQRTLAMIEEMKKLSPDKTSDKIALFQKSLDEAGIKIHELNDQKALLETRLKKTAADIAACAEAVKVSVKEKFTLKRLNQANPPKPILSVEGKVFAGTKISGRFANLILKENLSRVRIMEMHQNGENNETRRGWEMLIAGL
ncbi:MAG: FapA family protein [Pseudomonadota bacterium]